MGLLSLRASHFLRDRSQHRPAALPFLATAIMPCPAHAWWRLPLAQLRQGAGLCTVEMPPAGNPVGCPGIFQEQLNGLGL